MTALVVTTLCTMGFSPAIAEPFEAPSNDAVATTTGAQADSGQSDDTGADSPADDSVDNPSAETSDQTEHPSGDDSSAEGGQSAQASDQAEHPSGSAASADAKSGESASSHSAASSSAAEPADQSHKTIESTIHTASGASYTVKVKYDSAAAIPEGSQLEVAEWVMEPTEPNWRDNPVYEGRPLDTEIFASQDYLLERTSVLSKGLGVPEDGYMFYLKFLNITIKHDGQEITPKVPVEVTIETSDIDVTCSDAIELAQMLYVPEVADDPQAWEHGYVADDGKTAVAVSMENLTGERDEESGHIPADNGMTKFAFSLSEMGELALAGVVAPVMTVWQNETGTAQVLGPRSMASTPHEASANGLPENEQLMGAYVFSEDPTRAYGTTLWARVIATGVVDPQTKGYAAYTLRGGSWVGDRKQLGDAASTLAFHADEGVAFVRELVPAQPADVVDVADVVEEPVEDVDANVLEQRLPASNGGTYVVRVSYGPENGIPEGATLQVREVTGSEYYELRAQAVEAVDSDQVTSVRTLDITILDAAGNQVEPTGDVNVSISLTGAVVSGDAHVVHFGEEGPEVIEAQQSAAPADEGAAASSHTVGFTADEFSVYAIVYTAKQLELTASDGHTYRVTVTYDALSGIPESAELSVVEIREGDEGYEDYLAKTAEALGDNPENLALAKAFDITLVNPQTGETYQPNADVAVSIELLDEYLEDYQNVDVVHIHGDAADQAEVVESSVNGEAVEFKTDGFSVYVVTASGQVVTPRCTYKFFVKNETGIYSEYEIFKDDGTSTFEQRIKSGDELVVPQLASSDTQTFAGWYEGDQSSGTLVLAEAPYDFDNITIDPAKPEVDLYAVYKDYANVVFHGQYDADAGTFPVSFTRRAELTTVVDETTGQEVTAATVQISDLSATYNGVDDTDEKAFYGWSYTPFTIPGEGLDSVISENSITIDTATTVHLYPVFRGIHWLTYYAAQSGLSAGYVPPRYVFDGEGLSSPLPTSSRNDYVFLGWYTGSFKSETIEGETVETVEYGSNVTDANGTLANSLSGSTTAYIADRKLFLTDDTTLYAKWKAYYQVVIWKEKTTDTVGTTDKQYEYVKTETLLADIGDTVSAESYTHLGGTKGYEVYACGRYDNATKIGNTKEMTTLNVYYDLLDTYTPGTAKHTLTFTDSVTTTGQISPMPDTVTNLAYGDDLTQSEPTTTPVSVRKSEHNKDIYQFSGWYADQSCTIPVFFHVPTAEELKAKELQVMVWDEATQKSVWNGQYKSYVVYDKMPDHDVTVYAGWTGIKYRVQIDPNYGALYEYDNDGNLQGTGATWFNNTYADEPIGEYTQVTRDYVESSSGDWYYVKHDLNYYGGSSGPDRKTYYTQKPGEATEDTTFEYAPGTYSYVAWYEVIDGVEAANPYDFSQHTDHATTLKLKWKKNGAYYLAYSAGNGTLENGKKEALLPEGYTDYAQIILAQSAKAPTGKTFVGWQVRGDESGTVYAPGKTFTLHAEDAARISGKDIVYLDAVYVQANTASIVYNVNGGTISGTPDFGSIPGSSSTLTRVVDTDAGTFTISGLTNNTDIVLSNGTGFSKAGFEFLGWSNKSVYDPNDESAELYAAGNTDAYKYAVDAEKPNTLYAVWGVKVTYHLNNASADASWGGTDGTWGAPYTQETIENGEKVYTQTIYEGNAASEPSAIDATYVPTCGTTQMFYQWRTAAHAAGAATDDSDVYNFATPVTSALDLYAYWSGPIQVPVHAVDASAAEMVEKTNGVDGWAVSANIPVGTSSVSLPGSYVTPPENGNYTLAFVAAATNAASITEGDAINAIYYNQADKRLYVDYTAEGKADAPLNQGTEIYYVYYQQKSLGISYASMASSGALNAAAVTGAPTTTGDTLLGNYDMKTSITAPLAWADNNTDGDNSNDYGYYAYAIGAADAGNASGLNVITNSSASDANRPALQIRNTWRGFQYSEDNGTSWVDCGYNPQLYVVYYTQQPTVVMFRETTVGTSSLMGTEFTYDVQVTQSGSSTPIYNSGDNPFILKSGEAQSAVLFSEGDVTQTITIIQRQNANFDTSIGDEITNVWTYTSNNTGGTVDVTFTNTHKSLPVEVHVAIVESDGIVQRDNLRFSDEATYSTTLAPDGSIALPSGLPNVFAGNTDIYALGTVMYGSGTTVGTGDDSKVIVTPENLNVASVAYGHPEGAASNVRELLLKDGSGNTLGQLGSNQIYYLYYPMPQIEYVKQGANGALTKVSGSTIDETGAIVPVTDGSITYDHQPLEMNGKTVVQDQKITVSLDGTVISQNGSDATRMPPILDDGVYERYLGYTLIGAGNANATNISELSGTHDGLTMYLRVQDSTLQYSFDEEQWTNLPLSGVPTIYAIYTERGYDLQVSKTISVPEGFDNPSFFTNNKFTVKISSMAITKSSYEAEGADSTTVTATPASGANPGTIEFTVTDGSRVKIKRLGQGDYTIVESGQDNFNLSAKAGSLSGPVSPSPVEVADNSTVSLTLSAATRVDLTNSPKPLCKINDNGTDHVFYTLASAVRYVQTEIASGKATIEMLTDYLMPGTDAMTPTDAMVVPSGLDITLTTAERATTEGEIGFTGKGSLAIITRSQKTAAAPLFVLESASDGTHNASLTLHNVILEGAGASVDATAPMIQSAGDLTISSGAVIRNAKNVAGAGGAINSTAGNITISGGTVMDSSALSGGAIYYSGNGTISVTGAGKLLRNTATAGDGGAIYATGGSIDVAGGQLASISNNTASGKGGAIYTAKTVMTLGGTGSVSNNSATAGGAVYAETGTIAVTMIESAMSTGLSGNSATAGNGGAIWLGDGSIDLSGEGLKSNTAPNGNGGLLYAEHAAVTVSGGSIGAEGKANSAQNGGAIYAAAGAVTVSSGIIAYNTATAGNGGAVYAGSGDVSITGGSIANNSAAQASGTGAATTGNGGAFYAATGSVTVSGGSIQSNGAAQSGGAVYADEGAVTVSDCALSQNTAGLNGGAVYASLGDVAITDVGVSNNTANGDGGAIYAGSGSVEITNGSMTGNAATAGSGGAVYAADGAMSITDCGMSQNTAGQNGGAVYAGSGSTEITNGSMTNCSAGANGGAIYVGSGTLTATGTTMTGNSAVNGSAAFVNTGKGYYTGVNVTGNVSSQGGAIGVGSASAKLSFSGSVQVTNNNLGSADSQQQSNIYLDQDSDDVITIEDVESTTLLGIYVPDALTNARDVPGAKFATYISDITDADLAKISNDRRDFTIVKQASTKKLYWGKAIRVEVRYQASYANLPPTGTGWTQKKYLNPYYPISGDAAISELAEDIYNNNNLGLTATAAYGGSWKYSSPMPSFEDYATRLRWDSDAAAWMLVKHDGSEQALGDNRLYIYYAEPAYISIENNTDAPLDISSMTVQGLSVINSASVAGYGMVYAKNGAVRSALLPVSESDLQLAAGSSINLLIPGGRNMTYDLGGSFTTTSTENVRLRRTTSSGMSEETVSPSSFTLDGKTLNGAGTYQIIFGDDKPICKITDEHRFSKVSDAVQYAKNNGLTNVTIEMLVDYLLPASDPVLIPKGYNVTLTTATTGTYQYTPDPSKERLPDGSIDKRATISRDSENKNSMIATEVGDVNSAFTLSDLIIDGKSVQGSSDGGAVQAKFFKVTARNVDFVNVYAGNGGALYVNDKENGAQGKANSIVEAYDCKFIKCNSTKASGSRLGGGAIHAFADTLILDGCTFDGCEAADQAGAVFHRVDGNINSWTTITGCTFENCKAKAAGALELDSKTIEVTGTTFRHCVATNRNGGAFNIYALNTAEPAANTNVTATLTSCVFEDCHLTGTDSAGYGGAYRSNAVYNTVQDCTFTNISTTKTGGAIAFSNSNTQTANVLGCSIDGASTKIVGKAPIGDGGAIYSKALTMVIGDYTYPDESGREPRHTVISNCEAKGAGGAIMHDKDANGSSFSMTNATITGNMANGEDKDHLGHGGGVHTNGRTASITGSTISNNQAKGLGGGVRACSYTSLTITDSVISKNTAGGSGGAVWLDYNNETARNNMTLTISGSTMNGNTSGDSGGAIYTLAKTVTIQDLAGKPTTLSNNTAAKNAGGVYQSRDVNGSILTLTNSTISGCKANGGTGGGVFAGVRSLTASGSTVSNNNASGNGGGIWFDINNDTSRTLMAMSIEGCTLDRNVSGGSGGGVFTHAKTAEIKANADESVMTVVSNCTAAGSGGGVYQGDKANVAGSTLSISGAEIRNCSANDASTSGDAHGGGGVFAYARTITIANSEISGNNALRNGGGVLSLSNDTDRYLIVDGSQVTGNTAGNQGGGIYAKSQLTLKNNTQVTLNRLSTATVANAAGVFLLNNRTLTVGEQGSTVTDGTSVTGNQTASGAKSNMRLWEGSGQNNSQSVFVNCSLNGEIGVVNANKVGTWFGSTSGEDFYGFSESDFVFKADTSTLHGIYDRTYETKTRVVWAGPPIAKITDAAGNLLYLKVSEDGTHGIDPAIFDRLDGGNGTGYSTVGAFNMLRSDAPELYNADGTPYNGSTYCVKMLVETFETNGDIIVNYYEGRTVIFTTAGDANTDADYPYEGSASRSTVVRGSSVSSSRTLMNIFGNLTVRNIVIDGGAEAGIPLGDNTRVMYVDESRATVTLGSNATLQNGYTYKDGGGVYVNNGTLNIEGGIIRNCTARDGGAIYKKGSGLLTLTAGTIYQCTATGSGGGVYLNNGAFNMSGGSISDGSANQGGGLYVVSSSNAPFNMSGGSIVNNNATTKGGGIAVGGSNARLNFSKRVTVSGNTCNASTAPGKACNVRLDQDSKAVINTNNGGLDPGAYIGVYVPHENGLFEKRGVEKKAFGSFADGDSTDNLYSFVNDYNGLKGGIIESTDPAYAPNTIYWIQIFSLKVTKKVEAGNSSIIDEDEEFHFTVNITGRAASVGQKNAWEIDSSTGYYGEMEFHSNGTTGTTATFTLKPGESITGINLSNGLTYEVIEELTDTQAAKYAAIPTDTYSSTVGENKDRTDVDPYTSDVKMTNYLPVCKVTTGNDQLLYRRHVVGEGAQQKTYYAPAVFTELTGEDGAYQALDGDFFTKSEAGTISDYDVANGVKMQMLISNYKLDESIAVGSGDRITLTTAGLSDAQFPYQGPGTTSTIRRNYDGASMLAVNDGGDLTLNGVIFDGSKGAYTLDVNGGIANVAANGKLTIESGATLQNAKTSQNGGAVYVAANGAVAMTGGTIQRNETVGDGSGVYLEQGSTLALKGAPSFGGTGTDAAENIVVNSGNYKEGTFDDVNGGKEYTRARQDIFIAGYQDVDATSLVVNGPLYTESGGIWVWAAQAPHYVQDNQFARISDTSNPGNVGAFRNAQTDTISENTTGAFLYGVQGENGNIVWSGITGARKVVIQKVNANREALSGATFTIFKGNSTNAYTVKNADGSTQTLIDLASLDNGTIWVGDLPYGTYCMLETQAPDGYGANVNKWFKLEVSETGVSIGEGVWTRPTV